VGPYQKGKNYLDFTEARDSAWQWHQLGHMQVCTSLQTDNHASTPPLSFFTGWKPFLPPNNQHQSTEAVIQFNGQIIQNNQQQLQSSKKKDQSSHSLGYKKFQDFSRTPEAFFQDTVVSQQCLKYRDKQQLLSIYTV